MRLKTVTLIALLMPVACGSDHHNKLPHTPFLVLGDSLSAGWQSWSLNEFTQKDSYPLRMARQLVAAGVLPADYQFVQPLLDIYGRRLDPTVIVDNLAVPGAKLANLIYDRSGALPLTLTDILLLPQEGSPLDILKIRRPDVAVIWIGNNDLLQIISPETMDVSALTDKQFESDFVVLLDELARLPTRVLLVGLLNPLRSPSLLDAATIGGQAGDKIGWSDFLDKDPIVILNDKNRVLDAHEIEVTQARFLELQTFTLAQAAAHGITMVDMDSAIGVAMGSFTTSCPSELARGLFSFDLIHPTPTFNAVIGNILLEELGKMLSFTIAPIDVEDVRSSDPYIDHDGDCYVEGPSFPATIPVADPLLQDIPRDCAPFNAAINPDATEIVGDGIDQNCDGVIK